MVYRQESSQQSAANERTFSYPLNPANEWVQLADQIPWAALEATYQQILSTKHGRPATPFRQLYGAQLIKQRLGLTDKGTVAAIRESPAMQFFIGLPGYSPLPPFTSATLAQFRCRIAPLAPQIYQCLLQPICTRLQAVAPTLQVLAERPATRDTPPRLRDVQLLHQAQLGLPLTADPVAEKDWQAFNRLASPTAEVIEAQAAQQVQGVQTLLRQVDQALHQGGTLSARRTAVLTTIRRLEREQVRLLVDAAAALPERVTSLDPVAAPGGVTEPLAPASGAPTLRVAHVEVGATPDTADLGALLDRHADVQGHLPARVLVEDWAQTTHDVAACQARSVMLSPLRPVRASAPVEGTAKQTVARSYVFVSAQADEATMACVSTLERAVADAGLGPLLALFDGPLVLKAAGLNAPVRLNYYRVPNRPAPTAPVKNALFR